MGADLYRKGYEEIRDANKQAFDDAINRRDALVRVNLAAEAHRMQEEVEAAYDAMYPPSHYFRDSYNNSSLFWMLDLSWWGDTTTYTDAEYRIQPEGNRRLRKEAASRSEIMERKLADLSDDDPEDAATKKYFRVKLERFLAFLDLAYEAGDWIYCSV